MIRIAPRLTMNRTSPSGLKARPHKAQGFSPVLAVAMCSGLKGRQQGVSGGSLSTFQAEAWGAGGPGPEGPGFVLQGIQP